MTSTYTEASDQIYAIVNTAITAGATAVVGYVPAVYWPGIKEPLTVPGDKFWLRVSRKTVKDEQSTLCTAVGADTNRRYTNYGVLFVQVFCPQSVGNAYNLGIRLCLLVQDALRGRSTSGQVWFENVRLDELPIKDLFYRFNVIADYQYDDIG